MVGKSVLKLSKTDVVRSHGHLSSAFPPAVNGLDSGECRIVCNLVRDLLYDSYLGIAPT